MMFTFFFDLVHSVAVADINVIGIFFGFMGGLLITFFGLPSIGVLNQGMYVEIQITTRMRIYNWIARVGLFFVMLGFLLQLISAVQASKPMC